MDKHMEGRTQADNQEMIPLCESAYTGNKKKKERISLIKKYVLVNIQEVTQKMASIAKFTISNIHSPNVHESEYDFTHTFHSHS